jgi:hypothetical protein
LFISKLTTTQDKSYSTASGSPAMNSTSPQNLGPSPSTTPSYYTDLAKPLNSFSLNNVPPQPSPPRYKRSREFTCLRDLSLFEIIGQVGEGTYGYYFF